MVSTEDDPESAYAAYVTACEERANLASQAARRPEFEEQLAERVRAEDEAAGQAEAIEDSEKKLNEALAACEMSAMAPEQAIVELEAWEQRRQSELEALETARSEWSELKSLLGARTFDELSEARDAAENTAVSRATNFTESEVTALAAGDPVATIDRLRQNAASAGEAAASGEGALQERAKDLASVSEAEESEENASEELRWLQSLDGILATTQRFIAEAQERVQRDLAPDLRGQPPRVAAHHYRRTLHRRHHRHRNPRSTSLRRGSEMVVPVERLSQGTAEQVYLLLRAALARHLTAGKETCPLLLDDVTVQSDATRTSAILELLHDLSKEQQVIVFAQEQGVAEWARENLSEPDDALVELSVIGST